MSEAVTLYHPETQRTTTVPSEMSAAVLRESGWTDPPDDEFATTQPGDDTNEKEQ